MSSPKEKNKRKKETETEGEQNDPIVTVQSEVQQQVREGRVRDPTPQQGSSKELLEQEIDFQEEDSYDRILAEEGTNTTPERSSPTPPPRRPQREVFMYYDDSAMDELLSHASQE